MEQEIMIERLEVMAEVVAKLRAHFASTKTLEVFTEHVQADPCVSFHAQAECVSKTGHGWLVPMHEMAMKRLVVRQGTGDIYQIATAHRPEDIHCSRWHKSEYLSAEWIRTEQSYLALQDEAKYMMRLLLGKDVEIVERERCHLSDQRFEVLYKGLELGNFYTMSNDAGYAHEARIKGLSNNPGVTESQWKAEPCQEDWEVMKELLVTCTTGAIGLDRIVSVIMGEA